MLEKRLKDLGATLIEKRPGLVLAKREYGPHPYVTWAYNSDGFYWGHYFVDLAEAVADFNLRSLGVCR